MENKVYYEWVKPAEIREGMTKDWLEKHKPIFKCLFMNKIYVFTHTQLWSTSINNYVFCEDNLLGAGAVIIPSQYVQVLIPQIVNEESKFIERLKKALSGSKSDLQAAKRLFGANKLTAILFVTWFRRVDKGKDATLRGVKDEVDNYYLNTSE